MDEPTYESTLGITWRLDPRSGRFVRSLPTGTQFRSRHVYAYWFGAVPDGFEVHHLNGDRTDDRADNLIALSPRDHRRIHASINVRRNCRDCGDEFYGHASALLCEPCRMVGIAESQRRADAARHRTCVCEVCSREFVARAGTRYCSQRCVNVGRPRPTKRKPCGDCGQDFDARTNAVRCDSCKRDHINRLQRERRARHE